MNEKISEAIRLVSQGAYILCCVAAQSGGMAEHTVAQEMAMCILAVASGRQSGSATSNSLHVLRSSTTSSRARQASLGENLRGNTHRTFVNRRFQFSQIIKEAGGKIKKGELIKQLQEIVLQERPEFSKHQAYRLANGNFNNASQRNKDKYLYVRKDGYVTFNDMNNSNGVS